MRLTRITEEIVLDAPKCKAWAAIADYGNVHAHVQGVVASHLTSDVEQGVGATRHCDLPGRPGRNYIVEKIVDWREGESFAYVVVATNAPVTDARVRWAVSERGNGSAIRAEVEYRPKLGPLGALLDALVIRRRFRKQFREGLIDFKRELERAEMPHPAGVSSGGEMP